MRGKVHAAAKCKAASMLLKQLYPTHQLGLTSSTTLRVAERHWFLLLDSRGIYMFGIVFRIGLLLAKLLKIDLIYKCKAILIWKKLTMCYGRKRRMDTHA